MKNYYEILGIGKDASAKEIKSAFRKLSMQYHPDKNPNNKDAEEQFKLINEANQVLSDEEKRRVYDMGGNGVGFEFDPREQINDILKSMGFNVNIDFSQSNPFVRTVNQKVQFKHQINISLHDAIFGCEVNVDVPSYINCNDCGGVGGKKNTCHACNGAGQTLTFLGTMQYPVTCVTCSGKKFVLTSTCHSCNQEGYKKSLRKITLKVTPGVQHQTMLRINGDPNDRCDVIVIINVAKHPKINRNGSILYSTETISCLDAIIGGVKSVETIDGVCELIIPSGTQHGHQLTIENHGIVLGNNIRGNHIVSINIEVPRNLDEKQIAEIKKIRDNIKN